MRGDPHEPDPLARGRREERLESRTLLVGRQHELSGVDHHTEHQALRHIEQFNEPVERVGGRALEPAAAQRAEAELDTVRTQRRLRGEVLVGQRDGEVSVVVVTAVTQRAAYEPSIYFLISKTIETTNCVA